MTETQRRIVPNASYGHAKFLAFVESEAMGASRDEAFMRRRISFWERTLAPYRPDYDNPNPDKPIAHPGVWVAPAPSRQSLMGYLAIDLSSPEAFGEVRPGLSIVVDPHPRYEGMDVMSMLLTAAGIDTLQPGGTEVNPVHNDVNAQQVLTS